MSVHAGNVRSLIEGELRNVRDDRVVRHVQDHLVEPRAEFRDWDYGAPDESYLCWIALEHGSGTGIAYCQEGFGPRCPWGLVWTNAEGGPSSIGQDFAWYATFMDAYFESFAAADLPIWRLFSIDGGWPGQPLTEELSWADAWKRHEAACRCNPGSRFSVNHAIPYGA